MSLQSVAEEYFSSMNSMAARLQSDLKETKSSYEALWATLPEKEQQDILSESIIKPEVSIKYITKEEKPRTDYAIKMIFDDHCSYRDEHSGPFSFRTQSQRDLRVFQSDKPKVVPEKKTKPLKPKPKPIPGMYQQAQQNCADKRVEDDSSNTLPKTGLDFLDNW